ncbi:peptidylprolyl isomerase [Novosphingobium sp. CF614]|uniref:peptidylprolyl isomerase n=1 Tax=Novosphingobium sp. CF614 TaxID=1884364 RepID=UPI000B81EE1B|nr:peptidylprolyl isomerase [Novosphingobium sp. CF614]
MRKSLTSMFLAGLATVLPPSPLVAEDAAVPATPVEIVAAAPRSDWAGIAPSDLVVMDLAPDTRGQPRRVVIQLMPAPFSQGWVGNIRKLVAAHWYDGIAVVRVQDNYVVQWGDPDGEVPGKAKALPAGLMAVPESDYVSVYAEPSQAGIEPPMAGQPESLARNGMHPPLVKVRLLDQPLPRDSYASFTGHSESGWPIALDGSKIWPVHCYGMVGVGRNIAPDTGTGAELYAVIGQAPRQLDRNIALVGRVIEGIEHLSSLPRGTGPLGFYQTADERTPIVSVRMGDKVPDLPAYEYLSTESGSFAAYADKRANRKDEFYIQPAGGVDVCNVPVPVRRAGAEMKAVGK